MGLICRDVIDKLGKRNRVVGALLANVQPWPIIVHADRRRTADPGAPDFKLAPLPEVTVILTALGSGSLLHDPVTESISSPCPAPLPKNIALLQKRTIL